MSQAGLAIEAQEAGRQMSGLPELPTGRYQSPEFFQLEREYVWRRSWIFAGHEGDIPNSGDYVLSDGPNGSAIISRGANGVIRAFANTCRHRGSALLLKPSGKANRFVCPYHSWGYDTEGRLVSVPGSDSLPCLNKEEKGLLPLRCETWKGFLYVNFDQEAMPLAEYLAPASSFYEDIPFEYLLTPSMRRGSGHDAVR